MLDKNFGENFKKLGDQLNHERDTVSQNNEAYSEQQEQDEDIERINEIKERIEHIGPRLTNVLERNARAEKQEDEESSSGERQEQQQWYNERLYQPLGVHFVAYVKQLLDNMKQVKEKGDTDTFTQLQEYYDKAQEVLEVANSEVEQAEKDQRYTPDLEKIEEKLAQFSEEHLKEYIRNIEGHIDVHLKREMEDNSVQREAENIYKDMEKKAPEGTVKNFKELAQQALTNDDDAKELDLFRFTYHNPEATSTPARTIQERGEEINNKFLHFGGYGRTMSNVADPELKSKINDM